MKPETNSVTKQSGTLSIICFTFFSFFLFIGATSACLTTQGNLRRKLKFVNI